LHKGSLYSARAQEGEAHFAELERDVSHYEVDLRNDAQGGGTGAQQEAGSEKPAKEF
jgi:hypothetical protein